MVREEGRDEELKGGKKRRREKEEKKGGEGKKKKRGGKGEGEEGKKEERGEGKTDLAECIPRAGHKIQMPATPEKVWKACREMTG